MIRFFLVAAMDVDRFLSKLFLRELKAKERQALLFTGLALVLMLAYFFGGSRGFFVERILPILPVQFAVPDTVASFYQFASAFLLLLILPLVAVKLTSRSRLSELNFGLGDWRRGLVVAILGIVFISIPGGFFASLDPAFIIEYPLAKSAVENPTRLVAYELAYGLLYYVAWEGFFRGILQSELSRFLGMIPALLIQVTASTLIHIGKPVTEVWASLFAGMAFGIAVMHIRSIWPLVIVHWALGTATDLFCAHAAGLWP